MSYNTIRQKALEKLGSKCVQCGETDSLVLEVDHIDGDGHIDRQVRNGFEILKAISNGIGLESFQLLCANCHRLKHILGKYISPRELHLGVSWKKTRGRRTEKKQKPEGPRMEDGRFYSSKKHTGFYNCSDLELRELRRKTKIDEVTKDWK